MKIEVLSNLNLMPGNHNWSSDKIDFAVGEFNSWLQLGDEAKDITSLVIFFNKLFRANEVFEANVCGESALEEKLEFLKAIIGKHAKSKPTILSIYYEVEKSAISNAKMQSAYEAFYRVVYRSIEEMVASNANLYFVDLNRIFSVHGIKHCFSDRNYYLMRCPLSNEGLSVLVSSIEDVSTRIFETSKKVIAIDCDNTIWGGVVGEDGLSGLKIGQDGIGQVYADIQRIILNYKNQGFVICMLSKNNEEDVLEVFSKHPSMELQISDFVSWQINWENKFLNIRELANQLNVGLNSFVFIDDNPVERQQMQKMNPEVCTVNLSNDVYQWPNEIAQIQSLQKFTVTNEDINKTQMYQAKKKVDELKLNSLDDETFFQELDMVANFEPVTESSLSRAEQLCQKTNQFNMTTKRHNKQDLLHFMESDDHEIFLVSLKDKFGDHGFVGLFILKFDRLSKLSFIDTFLLSCRVLGRNLEKLCLKEILSIARYRGSETCVAEFNETNKNRQFASFFSDFGMNALNIQHSELQEQKGALFDVNDESIYYLLKSDFKDNHNLSYYHVNHLTD